MKTNYWRKKICGIYRIWDKTTDKSYIGKSVDVIGRWSDHGGIQNSDVSRAFWERPTDFNFEILEVCKEEELGQKEDFWILLYSERTEGIFNKQIPRGKRKKTAAASVASYSEPLLEALSALKIDKEYVAMAPDLKPLASSPIVEACIPGFPLTELQKMLKYL